MSSNVSPTPQNSAETVEVKEPIEFKEENGLKIDKRSKSNFMLLVAVPQQGVTALRCTGCSLLSSHSLVEVTMYEHDGDEKVTKRIIGCQNCGRISTK